MSVGIFRATEMCWYGGHKCIWDRLQPTCDPELDKEDIDNGWMDGWMDGDNKWPTEPNLEASYTPVSLIRISLLLCFSFLCSHQWPTLIMLLKKTVNVQNNAPISISFRLL